MILPNVKPDNCSKLILRQNVNDPTMLDLCTIDTRKNLLVWGTVHEEMFMELGFKSADIRVYEMLAEGSEFVNELQVSLNLEEVGRI